MCLPSLGTLNVTIGEQHARSLQATDPTWEQPPDPGPVVTRGGALVARESEVAGQHMNGRFREPPMAVRPTDGS